MVELTELLTERDLQKALDISTDKRVFIFKQSTTCPISTNAFSEFNNYADSLKDDIGLFFVKVRETREVSDQIAEEMNVQHESPQILLVKNKEVVWNTSHGNITANTMATAVK